MNIYPTRVPIISNDTVGICAIKLVVTDSRSSLNSLLTVFNDADSLPAYIEDLINSFMVVGKNDILV